MEKIICKSCGKLHQVYVRRKVGQFPKVEAEEEADPQTGRLVTKEYVYIPSNSANACIAKGHILDVLR